MSEPRTPPHSIEELHNSIVRVGQSRLVWRDLYAQLLQARWRWVLAVFFGAYVAANLLFATAYYASGDCIAGDRNTFVEAFFFSIQTMSTIGYGAMHPDLVCGHLIVTVESWVGLIGVAVVTGLVFAKFARPSSGALFSAKAVITERNGQPALMFRVANERGSEIVQASITATALLDEETSEGHKMRKLHDLELMRERTPLLLMSWLVIHPIDEASPLFGKSPEAFAAEDIRIIVSMTGIDGVFRQTVYSYAMYMHENIAFGHDFEDVISRTEDGRYQIDFHRFHDTQPTAAKT